MKQNREDATRNRYSRKKEKPDTNQFWVVNELKGEE